jgi:hypothetical protein
MGVDEVTDVHQKFALPEASWNIEGVVSKVQLVDPSIAAEILRYNAGNRKIDRATVEIYAAAMKRGEWKLSHQGIAVDEHGVLLDGQHRLEAILKSGVTIPMLVVRGVDRASFSVVDTGKRRSATDSLRTLGVPDVNHLAAALRYVYLFDTLPSDMGWSGHRARLTNDQILELYQQHPQMLDCVRQARSVAGAIGIISSACAAAIYITRRSAPDRDQSEWFNGVVSGANLDEGDPRLRLRNFFMNARAQGGRRRMDAREHLAVYIKAWNDWVRGEKRGFLAFRKGELMPKPMET